MDWDCDPRVNLHSACVLSAGVLHCLLRPRNLPPQSLDRVSFTSR
uniref:Uncharacterized protein n=1 Tax=Lotus japonicus TaxID=34305 RepID=I3T2I1_LOTJA|nr:unknown [Lotus japonicus]